MTMAEKAILTSPVTGRTCGSCTLCCKVIGITELEKPPGVWCKHCAPGKGCKIYQTRPDECRSFMCMWLVDERLAAAWKPDKSRIVITSAPDGNGLDLRCDPGFPAAWRKEPYFTQIKEMAAAAAPHDGTVMILVGNNTTVIGPDGQEFSLGKVAADQRIVREFAGSNLVDVRVVKAADNPG